MNCQYCEKPCLNENSLRNHTRLCKLNPNRQELVSNFIKYNKERKEKHLPGNNQHTKAKKEGKVIEVSIETRKKISIAGKGRRPTPEAITNMRIAMQKAVKEHPESYSGSNINGRCKKINYKDCLLDSSWEYEFVKWCEFNNIQWERNFTSFEYEWDGPRKYYPDFYIPSFDTFVEVKGYTRDKDIAKWKSVDNLIVIKHYEIQKIRKDNFTIDNFLSCKFGPVSPRTHNA